MFLDKEEHRSILLEMLSLAAVPGRMIDTVYDLKKSIESALVLPAPTEPAPAAKTDEPA